MTCKYPAPWTSEPEYISAQRVGTTGKAIIRDAKNEYVTTLEDAIAKRVLASVNNNVLLRAALTDLVNDVEASVDYGMPFQHPDHGFHESMKASYAALGLEFTPITPTVEWFNRNGLRDDEAPIIQQCITDLLAAGFSVSVVDGVHEDGDEVLSDSTDAAAIYGALGTTEGDTLNARRPHPNGKPDRFQLGHVQFIYGNDHDVIHDHSLLLKEVLAETDRIAHDLYSQNN